MAKYAHTNLIRFIKSDAKKIKSLNPNLKNTEISNVLSTYFGWRHFNELKINLDKEEILYCDTLQKISELNFDELNNLKNKYIRFVNKNFPQDKDNYDPYNIGDGGFGRLKNKKITYLKKIKNSPILDISLLCGETYIKLSNEETVNFLKINHEELYKVYKNSNSNCMWRGRGQIFLNAVFKALEKDPTENNYQTLLHSFCRFENLNKYFFNLKNKEQYEELENYIYNMPGYVRPYYDNGKYIPFEEIEQDFGVSEQHGFIAMSTLYILRQKFLNPDVRNKQVLNLRELKSYKGTIRVTHLDTGDISKDLKTLSLLL